MISAIGAPVVSNPMLLPSAESSSEMPSNETSLAGPTSSTGTDVLSLSQPQPLATNDGFYQRTSLKIRSRSHVKITDDGQVRSMSHTKLRFRYDFEAADGTRIRIRVKANLHYSQFNDGDEGSQSTRLRVKAKVLVLQEGVSTGIAPLLESPEVPSEAKNGITQAIDQFNQITEAATALFLNSDPLDGDSLIAGLVDSFNGLSDSLKSMFLPQPTGSEAEPSKEVVELLAPSVSDSEELPTPKPAQIEAIPPVSIEAEPLPLPEAPPQDIGQSDVPENELAEVVGPEETSTVENEAPLRPMNWEDPAKARTSQPPPTNSYRRVSALSCSNCVCEWFSRSRAWLVSSSPIRLIHRPSIQCFEHRLDLPPATASASRSLTAR